MNSTRLDKVDVHSFANIFKLGIFLKQLGGVVKAHGEHPHIGHHRIDMTGIDTAAKCHVKNGGGKQQGRHRANGEETPRFAI